MTPCYVCGNTTGPCEHMSAHLYPEEEGMDTTCQHGLNPDTCFLCYEDYDPDVTQMNTAPIDFSDIPFADIDITAHEETDQ